LVARTSINNNFDNLNTGKSEIYAGKNTAPTANDDTAYDVGGIWLDETNDKAYICLDNTDTSAVRKEISIDDLASLTGDSDDVSEGATNLYMTSAERSKLSGIEDSATADQTGAEIKALYEAEADTNAFTDADHSKLD